MPKSVVISEHAKMRAAERLDISRRDEIVHKFRHALMYGVPPTNFRGDFNKYLVHKLKKNKSSKIKVYCDFIYIYNNKKLITMFPVPDKYMPSKQYLSINYKEEQPRDDLPELTLRRYYHSGDFKFYVKNPRKNGNTYTVALVIKEELAAISRGKDLSKQKLACVSQHINELRDLKENRNENN